MAPMKSIISSQFWNEEIESTRALDAVAHILPNEPPPLGMVRSSKLFRSQQLLLLQRLFSLPCTPSYSDDGLVLDRVLASSGGLSWWATLTGRVRTPGLHLFSKQENLSNGSSPHSAKGWNRARCLLDGSLYALGMRTRVLLGPHSSFNANSEVDTLGCLLSGNSLTHTRDEKPWHARATLRHKLQQHDIIMEAAWNAKCVDRRGRYWKVPKTLSLDLASAGSTSGLRYRMGVHHSSGARESTGHSESTGQRVSSVPLGALTGTHAQAALSIEKEIDIWKDVRRKSGKPYNLLAAHPHVSLLGIVGGILSASLCMGGRERTENPSCNNNSPVHRAGDNPVSADVFASLGFTAQFGCFKKPLLDYTKLGARLDLGAASTLVGAASNSKDADDSAFPTFEVTLQQQVMGPVRARIDSRFSIDPSCLKRDPHLQDLTYGLDCSLESLGAAKLVFWYSPVRREGMVEMRVLEG